MKTLKFRYIAAWNFMPFGPEGIEIFFDDYGQVVLVNGLNLDTGTDVQPASNGAGKSSIIEIISYALYGKTVKKPKKLNHDDVINKVSKEKLVVEVQFDDYRIVRGRSPDKLDVWHSKDHIWDKTTKISKGKQVQEMIEGIVGLSHTAFCNVVVFDDSNSYSFLELDTAGKRQVVENLLGLDRYRSYQEAAKSVVKDCKQQIRDTARDYENLQTTVSEADSRITKIQEQESTWKTSKQQEIDGLQGQVQNKQSVLSKCDGGDALAEYEESQQHAADLAISIDALKQKKTKLSDALREARVKLREAREGLTALEETRQSHRLAAQQYHSQNIEAQRKLADLQKLPEGATCPTCHGSVSRENFNSLIKHEENILAATSAKHEKEELLYKQLDEQVGRRRVFISKLEDSIADTERKEASAEQKIQADVKIMNKLLAKTKPVVGELERSLEVEIVNLKKQIEDKQAEISGISPYKEILEHAIQERDEKQSACVVKAKELEQLEEELPYNEFWVEAFGDKGIRKHLIDKIIPALNARVAYWLQYLIDSKIELTFDGQLEETITRNGIEAKYHAMSNGEKRRINLAVSQAFAYVMMLNSGHCPSIVFLDEITGGGIDHAGVTGVYNMIYELAKERQVFVTSHNNALLRMLEGCQSINLIKKDDITKLVSSS
jgi:DNA repair exonuclease SbcCD ATPase subunit